MSKKLTILLLKVVLLFIALIPFLYANEADQYLANNRTKFFSHLVQEIESSHVFPDTKFKKGQQRFSWKANLPRIKNLFIKAQNQNDVFYAILALQKNLKNNHSYLRMPESFYTFPVRNKSLPFRLRYNGSNYEVSISENPEVTKGLILKSFNGKNISQLENELLLWHGSSSLEHFRLDFSKLLTRPTARIQPVPSEISAMLEFLDPKTNKILKLNLAWSKYDLQSEFREDTSCGYPLAYDDDYKDYKVSYVGINYCVYESFIKDSIILRFFSFNYNLRKSELEKRLSMISPSAKRGLSIETDVEALEKSDLAQLVELFNAKKIKNLLIDVRENNGGNINPELIAALAQKDFKILERKFVFTKFARESDEYLQAALSESGESMKGLILSDIKNKKQRETRLFPFYCKTKKCEIEERLYQASNSLKFDKLFVLSGPYCLSSCDQFVSIIKDNGLGLVMGLPSQGSHAPFRALRKFQLANQQDFYFEVVSGVGLRPNGENLEGNPPSPDIKFYPDDNSLKTSESFILK